jgi:hypothetical protein
MVRFSLGAVGPVTEIEFSTDGTLFGATAVPTDGGFGSFIRINPNDGIEELVGVVQVFKIDPVTGLEIPADDEIGGALIALEFVEDTLYGIYLGIESNSSKLVTVDQSTGAATIVGDLTNFTRVDGLAYDPTAKIMYGGSVSDLITISLEVGVGVGTLVASMDLSQPISALEFDGEGTLFAATADRAGETSKLLTIALTTDPATGAVIDATATEVGSIVTSTATPTLALTPASSGVSGLAFVPGEVAPPPDPINTICSSALTDYSLDSSESADSKIDHTLTKSKFTNKSRHKAMGLFKFEGKAGEVVTITLASEGVEEETLEESPLTGLMKWLQELGFKRRSFLGLRDAIPDVDFRVKKKGALPLVLGEEYEELVLPADGQYYIMVMQPLRRLYRTDYCLEVKSDDPESLAWQTLKPAWSTESSAEEASETSEETSTVESQDVDVGAVNDDSLGDTAGESPEDNSAETPVGVIEEPTGDVTDEPSGDLTGEPESITAEETPAEVTEEPTGDVTDEPSDDLTAETDRLNLEKTGDVTDEPESVIPDDPTSDDAGDQDVDSEIN